jgi:hypothetical protein
VLARVLKERYRSLARFGLGGRYHSQARSAGDATHMEDVDSRSLPTPQELGLWRVRVAVSQIITLVAT